MESCPLSPPVGELPTVNGIGDANLPSVGDKVAEAVRLS